VVAGDDIKFGLLNNNISEKTILVKVVLDFQFTKTKNRTFVQKYLSQMHFTKKISFLFGYTFPIFIVLGGMAGGFWAFSGVIYAYFFIPILDQIIGRDSQNILKSDFETLLQDWYFDLLVYSSIYIHYGLLFWGGWLITMTDVVWYEKIGIALSVGVYASGIINVAHELGHRSNKIAQWHARAALMSVSYMHFVIEHNRGHHVHVATPNDPATSKKNQTIFQFWIQTLVGSYQSAWQIESRRLEREKKLRWSVYNEMLWFAVLPILLCVTLTIVFFIVNHHTHILWQLPLFFVVQSIVAILSLECVNYIEHYGIVRREISAGKYERVNPLHSWNANHLVSNLVLFQLQRHSDHHAFASRPYQVLRHFDESPQLPFGYPIMILMSLMPPLWFNFMNPRLEQWQAKAYDSEHIAAVVKQFV
jgi:alkane 1-monooxygenase